MVMEEHRSKEARQSRSNVKVMRIAQNHNTALYQRRKESCNRTFIFLNIIYFLVKEPSNSEVPVYVGSSLGTFF